MANQNSRRPPVPSLPEVTPFDGRDRMPGTHFAAEIGSPPKRRKKRLPPELDPHVDEDLGCAAFGIDLLKLGK